MRRVFVLAAALSGFVMPAAALAQGWNDAQALDLVRRATERRAQQIADPLLADYTAEATGKVVFQFKAGEGFPIPPVTVQATEIVSKLYWMQPGRSKQVIIGLRDTMLFPGNIGYYTERYGIIQNNFPDVIRLGDGRDVRDVPHPLSMLGLAEYDFAVRDSVSITLADQTIDVFKIAVRPKDAAQPRVAGSVYLARESGAVVKMEFAFTRAAYLDRRNEDLTVTLENALIEGRFWLPRRQSLSLTRHDPVLDLPARAMIRAWWDVCCYSVNSNTPASNFVGPEIIRSSPQVLAQHQWKQNILDALPPEVRILNPDEVRKLREEAEQIVRASALSRMKGGNLFAPRVSEFLRVNRVEGLALGGGFKLHTGTGISFAANARYGFADHDVKGRVSTKLDGIGKLGLELYAERAYLDVGVVQERSLVTNSLASPLTGSDFTNPYDVRAAGLVVDLLPLATIRPRVEISWQSHSPVSVNADPLSGSFAGVVPAARIRGLTLSAGLHGNHLDAVPLVRGSLSWNVNSEIGSYVDRGTPFSFADSDRYLRLYGNATVVKGIGAASLRLSAFAGTVMSSAQAPPQKLLMLGGPVSAPGYNFHELVGTTAANTRVEIQFPVAFPSISLGRYGRSPANITLAPYVGTAYLADPPAFSARRAGFYPSAGIGTLLLFDLLRIDVARGLRDGRWTFSADIMRELWGIL